MNISALTRMPVQNQKLIAIRQTAKIRCWTNRVILRELTTTVDAGETATAAQKHLTETDCEREKKNITKLLEQKMMQ